jgi:solute carrier family 6 noradrenalin transporter-like protein 2
VGLVVTTATAASTAVLCSQLRSVGSYSGYTSSMADEDSVSGLKLAMDTSPQDSPCHLVPGQRVKKRNLIVKTTTKNPNKFFHFFKPRHECPPTYDEAVNDDEWSTLDPTGDKQDLEIQDPSKSGEDAERETWGSNLDFLLSIIGFAVDLANVWRFPYLCYKNGGGAFLIPYASMLILGALPLFYMELILGQFHRQGPISVWRISPIFKGVGFCAVFIAFFVSFYYNVIIGWAFHFLFSSFSWRLPWKDCMNEWNTEFCAIKCLNQTGRNDTEFDSKLFKVPEVDSIVPNHTVFSDILCTQTRSPAKEYFNLRVLRVQDSEGIHDLGTPQWQLVICIGVVYCLLYISLFKGVKSSGKVVWITATMPYVVLTILLVRGLMLEGAVDGIKFYLHVDWNKLLETGVWIDAAIQIFYSVGAGFGVHLAYASYNKFHNNCYRDCLVTSAVNSFTSFFSGFVIFTYLGYMAHSQNKDIEDVADQGPGLVFEVYPQAVATLPGSQFWSVIFFFMLIMLGMDSAMGGLECVITGLMDEYQEFFRKRRISREVFTGFVVFSSYLVAITCVTPGGFYIFSLLENYAAGLSLLTTVFFEAVAVSWVYGLKNFSEDVYAMLGHRPGLYWKICWKFVSPCFLAFIIILQMTDVSEFTIEKYDGTIYTYPAGAHWTGRILAASTISCIPIAAIIVLIKARKPEGSSKSRTVIQCLGAAITPSYEVTPDDQNVRLTWAHWRNL